MIFSRVFVKKNIPLRKIVKIMSSTKLIQRANEVVCEYYGISPKCTYLKEKTRLYVRARSMVVLYLNKKRRIPMSKLSHEYGKVVRTLRWNNAQLLDLIRIYADYRKEYEDIIALLDKI